MTALALRAFFGRLVLGVRAGATLIAVLAASAWAVEAAVAGPAERALRSKLADAMSSAGPASGAYVEDVTTGRRLFARRAARRRSLASNTKLLTTSAALDRFGPANRLLTRVAGDGRLLTDGTWRGRLYLVGGGDPTFGSRSYAEAHGSGASVEALAKAVQQAGIERVRGRILGDESRYDQLRGGPASGYGVSPFVGPLSALAFSRGLGPGGFASDPPRFAANRLTDALEDRGIEVLRAPAAGAAPSGAVSLAAVRSPTLGALAASINKPSDNFFAELLAKELSTRGGRPGSTDAGARRARRFARGLGARIRVVDGSGLARANRASPRAVVTLLAELARRRSFAGSFPAFLSSLAVAGRDGTLGGRMRGRAAEGRCRAKTGTLIEVSALSGYCDVRGGRRLAFSFLMNRTNVNRARRIQDRMTNVLARYRRR